MTTPKGILPGPRNWATNIYSNLVWAKVQLIRREMALSAGIGLRWYKLVDDIPFAIGQVPDFPSVNMQATWLTSNEIKKLFFDFIEVSANEIGAEMAETEAFMLGKAYQAFKDKAPWLDALIPYNNPPASDYGDILSVEFLGTSLDAWKKTLEASPDLLPAMRGEFIAGMQAGESMPQIAKRIAKAGGIARRSAMGMARTAVQAAANDTLNRVYRANGDIIKGYTFTATLDTRTCPICGGYDRRRYSSHSTRPGVPVHPSCRCLYTPIVKSLSQLGLGPAEIPDAKWRASMDGKAPATMDYGEWFKQQDPARQINILGNKRWKMWKAGEWMPRFLEQGHMCGDMLIYEEAA